MADSSSALASNSITIKTQDGLIFNLSFEHDIFFFEYINITPQRKRQLHEYKPLHINDHLQNMLMHVKKAEAQLINTSFDESKYSCVDLILDSKLNPIIIDFIKKVNPQINSFKIYTPKGILIQLEFGVDCVLITTINTTPIQTERFNGNDEQLITKLKSYDKLEYKVNLNFSLSGDHILLYSNIENTIINPAVSGLITEYNNDGFLMVDSLTRKYLKYKNKYIQLKNKLI